MVRQGVNVSLGTDSLATVRPHPGGLRLDMFAEMRAFSRRFPDAAPETILRMATVNPAAALGQKGLLGELRTGARADAIAMPYRGSAAEAYDAIVQHEGPVMRSMIGGKWAMGAPGT
jgi:cytosine/adenosine deaminase-related metal-dependent hydrolase